MDSPNPPGHAELANRSAVESSAIDPFFGIYFARYLFALTANDQVLTGFYYLYGTNALFGSAYPGNYQLTAGMLGYKRFIWAGAYAEWVLLSGLARYDDTIVIHVSNSFEVWSELHIGYQFDFKLGTISFYVNPEVLVGISVFKGNEPESFRAVERLNPAFGLPDLYVLPNVIIGIKF